MTVDYSNHLVRVAWGDAVSDYFSAVNGVKQGGVLSLVLYCVYIADLLSALSKSGVGCYFGKNLVGALLFLSLLLRLQCANYYPYAESMQLNIVFRSMPLNPGRPV